MKQSAPESTRRQTLGGVRPHPCRKLQSSNILSDSNAVAPLSLASLRHCLQNEHGCPDPSGAAKVENSEMCDEHTPARTWKHDGATSSSRPCLVNGPVTSPRSLEAERCPRTHTLPLNAVAANAKALEDRARKANTSGQLELLGSAQFNHAPGRASLGNVRLQGSAMVFASPEFVFDLLGMPKWHTHFCRVSHEFILPLQNAVPLRH